MLRHNPAQPQAHPQRPRCNSDFWHSHGVSLGCVNKSKKLHTMDSPRAKLTQCEPPNYGATRTRGSTPSSSSEKQHYADTSSTRSLSTCSSDDTRVDLEPQAPRKRTCSCHLDHVFQWALKILGVAAAIVFGVWAPVSYRLQAEGNRSGDESMAKLVGAVGELVRRVEGLEKWRALEVCGGEGFRVSYIILLSWFVACFRMVR